MNGSTCFSLCKMRSIFSTQRKYKIVSPDKSEPAFGGAQAKAYATNAF
jgi:hypothetical protein